MDAKLNGCTCHVEVVMREVEPNVWHTRIAHDDGCPVIADGDRRTVQVVTKP
jgi:hypothetical protein